MAMPPPPPPPPHTPGPMQSRDPFGKRPRGWMFWTWVVCWVGFMVVTLLRILGVGR